MNTLEKAETTTLSYSNSQARRVPVDTRKADNRSDSLPQAFIDLASLRKAAPRGRFVAKKVWVIQIPAKQTPKIPKTAKVPPPVAGIPQPPGVAFIKHGEHLAYLKRVSESDQPLISPQTAKMARIAWQMIWNASGFAMPVPAACTGPDGEMYYSWDRGRHHLELEIIPGQPAEFFYRNRETEELWGEDYNIGDPLSADAIQKLKLLV